MLAILNKIVRNAAVWLLHRPIAPNDGGARQLSVSADIHPRIVDAAIFKLPNVGQRHRPLILRLDAICQINPARSHRAQKVIIINKEIAPGKAVINHACTAE